MNIYQLDDVKEIIYLVFIFNATCARHTKVSLLLQLPFLVR
jgi:hypothetical protein